MKKCGIFGCSKYDLEPWKFEKDISDRETFYREVERRIKIYKHPLEDVYKELISLNYFTETIMKIYREAGYEFTITYEGYRERVCDLLFK